MSGRMEELAGLMVEQKQAVAKQQDIDSLINVEMPSSWKVSHKGMDAVRIALGMAKTKHGLYASIPMLCKAEECPYASVCPLIELNAAPKAERCPLEIAMILKMYKEYADEFGTEEDNIVDMGFIKELIDCDIQIFRADNKIAVQGDFVEDVVVGVSDSGEALTAPQLSKATEYKEKIMNKKHKILQLMNSTRKDKAGDKLQVSLDPSSYAAQLMQQAVNMGQITVHHKRNEALEGEYTEIEETEE